MESFTVEALPKDIVFGTTGVVEVLQNVRTIISTRKGTVPLDRDFGISFDFLDTPIDTVRGLIQTEIFMALRKYEPRAELREITWDMEPMAGRVVPKVSVNVRL